MSEEEITIENLRKNKGVSFAEADIILNLIEKQQKEIDKQNKVIDEMSRIIMLSFQDLNSIEEVKQYFTRKANGDER